ncbi:hypothetical protein [Paraglaciecola aestuariivivens]
MQRIRAWFFKVTNIPLILAMCVIYLFFPLYLLPGIINTGELGPLDLRFWYNHEILYSLFIGYGETLRFRYIVGLISADLAYPIFYGTLLALLIAWLIKNLPHYQPSYVIFLPFMVVFFDLFENTLLIYLLLEYPVKHLFVADLAGFVTATKWSGFACISVLILALVGKLIKRHYTAAD